MSIFSMSYDRSREVQKPLGIDVVILSLTLLLVGFSLVMIYSTTGVVSQEKYGDAFFFLKRQGVAVLVGLILMAGCAAVPHKLIRTLSPFCFPLAIFLLVLTLIPSIQDEAGGAHRWIVLGPLRFQPGELVKVLFTVFMGGYFARHSPHIEEFWKGLCVPLLYAGVIAGLFLLQPDFGSAVVVVLITIGMALVAGVKLRFIFGGALVLALLGATLILVSPYRMRRIASFLSPFEDASGKGYQLIQSLIALGSGNLSGVGLGGSQQKLFFLPAAHTDFIFSVIGEELGFIGCGAIIVAFLVFLWRGLSIARRHIDDTFSYVVAVGLTLLIVVPELLNTGVATGLLPTKGMVLPLIGYGGSSVVSCLIAIGLLLSLSRAANER